MLIAGEICGSRPLPEAVTISAGIVSFFTSGIMNQKGIDSVPELFSDSQGWMALYYCPQNQRHYNPQLKAVPRNIYHL